MDCRKNSKELFAKAARRTKRRSLLYETKIPQGIDYSKYKGRGRYSNIGATQHDAHNTTINATFAIDPSRNDGLDYAYEEVVRGKKKRRNLHGGDCECCRDYYEGGMPLWKSSEPNQKASPVTTPRRERKKGISRHRHQWAQGGTPPDYWNIGFPDTQEVESRQDRLQTMSAWLARQMRAYSGKISDMRKSLLAGSRGRTSENNGRLGGDWLRATSRRVRDEGLLRVRLFAGERFGESSSGWLRPFRGPDGRESAQWLRAARPGVGCRWSAELTMVLVVVGGKALFDHCPDSSDRSSDHERNELDYARDSGDGLGGVIQASGSRVVYLYSMYK
ncbi:hypothetical protein BDZ89DRAFT_1192566 [Hymenopellis radicata]|nr:hypothetical protein BDZ89DRAFT_1192566 [Hymenopellis radicata]